jgi:hypothetical protein
MPCFLPSGPGPKGTRHGSSVADVAQREKLNPPNKKADFDRFLRQFLGKNVDLMYLYVTYCRKNGSDILSTNGENIGQW